MEAEAASQSEACVTKPRVLAVCTQPLDQSPQGHKISLGEARESVGTKVERTVFKSRTEERGHEI